MGTTAYEIFPLAPERWDFCADGIIKVYNLFYIVSFIHNSSK